jgi:hypothetical protein
MCLERVPPFQGAAEINRPMRLSCSEIEPPQLFGISFMGWIEGVDPLERCLRRPQLAPS